MIWHYTLCILHSDALNSIATSYTDICQTQTWRRNTPFKKWLWVAHISTYPSRWHLLRNKLRYLIDFTFSKTKWNIKCLMSISLSFSIVEFLFDHMEKPAETYWYFTFWFRDGKFKFYKMSPEPSNTHPLINTIVIFPKIHWPIMEIY